MSITNGVFEVLTLGAILALAVGLHITFEGPARTYIRRAFSGKGRPRSIGTQAPKEPVAS